YCSTGDATANATPVLVGDSSGRKRRRTSEELAPITAADTHTPWDKAELSNRMQQITDQLQVIRGDVSEVLKLYGLYSASSSNHSASTPANQHLRTSSLAPRKVYGRVIERNYIMQLIAENKSDGVTILPIVGIAGVGKTALTQLVYNDPDVESLFDHRIWISVSRNFDEIRFTMEMLSFVSQERHEGTNCFARLQENLKSHVKSKRVLLILDDVWDDKNDCRWNLLLDPFKSDSSNGNVILVTTRKSSVAKMMGTTGPINLHALENDDFWLLFKSCAFGDGDHEGPPNLSTVGRKIADKLKGNPLAAISAGRLLRDDLSIEHWSNILKKENWKSLGLSGGIMSALKLSYDELPYQLQQCISYCSIFPDKYMFLGKDLVYIWISQGFVHCNHLSKRSEETGWEYLNVLVNMGFFQQIEEQKELDEEEEFSLHRQIWYSVCDLMHDFARLVSRAEYAIIDGLQSNKMLPTIYHLSIITDYAYNKDRHGKIPRNEKFEENLRNSVTSVTKLRTLVVLGNFDSFFVQLFQDIFQKAHNLRLLQVSPASTYPFQVPAASADFNSFLCSLANPLHLRYIKLKWYGVVPQVLCTFFHLQVLDVGSNMETSLLNGLHNLVSLRHLIAYKRVHSSIANIGNMTSIQELHDFKVRISTGFEITQLKSMNELVQLGVSQLGSVKTWEEAYEAGLRNKEHLEELHLSWNDTFPENESVSDTRPESSVNMAREVIDGLQPHMDLKHLQISGYNGTTSPTWLAKNISVTSLQTLHLDDCGGWQILPSLESLPLLTRLKLRSMQEVIQVLVPSLQELDLGEMPKLERCSCSSVGRMSSSLKELQIRDCPALKEFDLFENNNKFEIKCCSWLPSLRKLILCHCPQLKVLKPLPPSTTCSELLISGVSMLPDMEGSSSGNLRIGYIDQYTYIDTDEYSYLLRILDESFLAFRNLGNLKSMKICGQKNLRSFSFEGFSHLTSLKSLVITGCEKLFSSDVTQPTLEDVTAFPSLGSLTIKSCGIAGKQLSLMLQHAPNLEELDLKSLEILTEDLSSGDPGDAWSARKKDFYIPLNLASSLKKITTKSCPGLTFIKWSDKGFSGFASLEMLPSLEELEVNGYYSPRTLQSCFRRHRTSLKKLVVEWAHDLHTIHLRSCMALEKLEIRYCRSLKALEGLQFLGRLTHLNVSGCPGLVHQDGNADQANGKWLLPTSLRELKISNSSSHGTLKPCFPTYSTSLETLEVRICPDLQSIQLDSCTALDELKIGLCRSLTALEGLEALGSIRHLDVSDCPGLKSCLESFSRLCPRLETLCINDTSVLTTSFCKHLTSLQRLQLARSRQVKRLTDEQERALVLLKSLKELKFSECHALVDLPAGLQNLPFLKILKVRICPGISRLPVTGLPLSLEELEIYSCSKELADECRLLATSKLNVKIDWCF
ncbi:disease resistance protein RGA2-like, partial [Hordeum vulgare subsp. vulgare]|uniref:disease resistance protein RGA2-like n=1 Tax=Hordeum vulgare subsp. vulgare TaxID=112509 RepID=UPI001D1A46F3